MIDISVLTCPCPCHTPDGLARCHHCDGSAALAAEQQAHAATKAERDEAEKREVANRTSAFANYERFQAAERRAEKAEVELATLRAERDRLLAVLRLSVSAIESLESIIVGEYCRDWADHFGADYEFVSDTKDAARAALADPAPQGAGEPSASRDALVGPDEYHIHVPWCPARRPGNVVMPERCDDIRCGAEKLRRQIAGEPPTQEQERG